MDDVPVAFAGPPDRIVGLPVSVVVTRDWDVTDATELHGLAFGLDQVAV